MINNMRLFNFKNDKKMFNGVVFTCRHFMDKGERVTYISHKENGDYECFCSNCEQKLDLNSVMIIGLDEILTENNNSSLTQPVQNPLYVRLHKQPPAKSTPLHAPGTRLPEGRKLHIVHTWP